MPVCLNCLSCTGLVRALNKYFVVCVCADNSECTDFKCCFAGKIDTVFQEAPPQVNKRAREKMFRKL